MGVLGVLVAAGWLLAASPTPAPAPVPAENGNSNGDEPDDDVEAMDRELPEEADSPPHVPDVIEQDPDRDELTQVRELEREAIRFDLLYPVARPLDDRAVPLPERARPPVGLEVHQRLGTTTLRDDLDGLAVVAARSFLQQARDQRATLSRVGAPLGPVAFDIPIADNAMVQQWIRFFQGVGAKYYRKWVARYWRYGPVMRRILEEQGLPSDLVYLSMIESGFSPKAYSFAHAVGPWQFIRATGTRMGLTINFWVDERRDPVKSTHAAARYLRTLYATMGDWHLAWASYNAGPGKVARAIRRHNSREFFKLAKGRPLRWETRNYVPKLIAAAIIAKDPAAHGFGDVEPLPLYTYDTLDVPDSMALSSLAVACGVEEAVLLELNSELRRPMTPPVPDGAAPYPLRVPPGSAAACRQGLERLTDAQRTVYRRHRAGAGDTLETVAKRYGTTPAAIVAENHLPNTKLKAGEDLLVPVPPGPTRPPLGDMADEIQESRGRVVRAAQPRGTRAVRVTVNRGDTLWDIATRYGVDVRSVAAWNGLNRRGRLRIGQRLVLYVRAPDPPPRPPPP
jgi:membrane-bound lytic murein transglycosylase D